MEMSRLQFSEAILKHEKKKEKKCEKQLQETKNRNL